MTRYFGGTFTLILFATAAWGQDRPAGIWGPAVPGQPFDSGPLRMVRIPDWVEDTLGCGYTLSVMDSAARKRAVQHGVRISELGFVDPLYAYYDSKLLKHRSPYVPADRLKKDIAEYKRRGIRILAVYPPTLQGEVYAAHPDWRRIPTRTTTIPQVDLKTQPHGGMLCLLGPYGDFFIDVLAEILTRFPDVDAFSFDGLHHGGVCYCQHCRANYRRDTGQDIPGVNLEDPAFRRYQHWADRRLEGVIRRAQEGLKRIKPNVALVTWTTNAGRYGHLLSIPRNMPARMNLLLDAPDQELWLDETNRGLTIVPAFGCAYAWAVSNHRVAFSEPYLMSHGNPYGKDSFPPHEVLCRMLLVVTYGAAPSIAVGQPERLQGAIYHCLDEVNRRRPWLTRKQPEPWAALVMSDNTRTFYGRSPGQVEERYLASVLGTFRTTVEEHLPVTLVNDWNLTPEDLARYKVLILANTACLDDRQVRAIARFVRGGGGLVASLDTSLFDEQGNPRRRFALADVLGVDYRGLPAAGAVDRNVDVNFAKAIGPDYWQKRKGVFDFRHDAGSFLESGKMKSYVGGEPVTFKGPAVRVAPRSETKTVGTIQHKDGSDRLPAVVRHVYGKGRVVYLAAGLDAGYYLYPYPYQRLVLHQAIRWAASGPPPVEVRAPMCVHATIMRQPEAGKAGRLVVHLFNDLNTTAGHALSNEDVPLREEVVPLSDIRVTFRPEYRLRRVTLQPEGKSLEVRATADGHSVVVPRLEVHAMVVAELDRDE